MSTLLGRLFQRERSHLRIRLAVSGLVLLAAAASCVTGRALPNPSVSRGHEATAEENEIERQFICIGSTVASAGDLGPILYYRHAWEPDGRLTVGYYTFFSQERPWGNNWLTWLVVPAMAVDLVYTRTLFVGPGIQRARYGKGDVEGFRIIYDVEEGGRLSVDHAVADDSSHRERMLGRSELFRIDPNHVTLYTESWSHHLGTSGARSAGDLSYCRCYGPESIRPLPAEIAREFHLERRAQPAAVGSFRQGGPQPQDVALRPE